MIRSQVCDFRQGLSDDGRVQDPERRDIRRFSPYRPVLQVFGPDHGLAQQDHREDYADNAQRIRDRTAESRRSAVQPELVQGLLGRTQGRRIGRRPAEDADHVRQADRREPGKGDGHERSDQDDPHPEDIQFHAAFPEGVEETGTDLEAQGVHEDDQAEILRESQHLRVDGQAEMTGQDTAEENEGDTQRNTGDLDPSQHQTGDDDQENDHDRLHGGITGKKCLQETHSHLSSGVFDPKLRQRYKLVVTLS